jgi:hypothetical protein
MRVGDEEAQQQRETDSQHPHNLQQLHETTNLAATDKDP